MKNPTKDILDILTGWLCFTGILGVLTGILSISPGKIAELYLISLEFTFIPKVIGILFFLVLSIISFKLNIYLRRTEEKYSIEG